MAELSVVTRQKADLVDITRQVSRILAGKNVRSGSCVVFAKHTTCGILFGTPAEARDILDGLAKKVPADAAYQHGEIDGNAHAHLKAILVGCEKTLQVRDSQLALPGGSAVFLAEFDGPQERKIEVAVV